MVQSQNFCPSNLPPDSRLCSVRADSCTNPVVRSVCPRYCRVCIDGTGPIVLVPRATDPPVADPDCQDKSQFCDRFLNRCSFEKIKLECRRACGLCGDAPQTTTVRTPATNPTTARTNTQSTKTLTESTPGQNTPKSSIEASSTKPTISTTMDGSSTKDDSTTVKSTVRFTTIDKETSQLLNSASK